MFLSHTLNILVQLLFATFGFQFSHIEREDIKNEEGGKSY